MNSTRLPGKPLLKIGDKTIIERCVEIATAAGYDPIVATPDQVIADAVPNAVLTGPCDTGTDRVAEAARIIDPKGKHEFVINYQGDMPFLQPGELKDFIHLREIMRTEYDILTGYTFIDAVEMIEPYKVFRPGKTRSLKNEGVRGFRRTSLAAHVGIYGYTSEALRRFSKMPRSEGEKYSELEQLRAPEEFKWGYDLFYRLPFEINDSGEYHQALSLYERGQNNA